MDIVDSMVSTEEQSSPKDLIHEEQKKHVLILGVNGFIGNALTERLLEDSRYEVCGVDINTTAVARFFDHPNFQFYRADITVDTDLVEALVSKADVVLPLVAIATPIEYSHNPLGVFKLDFEENLKVIRTCVAYSKRIIFPSTSEVYGMSSDTYFCEESSFLVQGPINKQRWIYSCIKQLLDRLIWAYGIEEGLDFTLFRPFNWTGARLDTLEAARSKKARLITQLILNLIEGTPIQLVDGGLQKRCFTDLHDGIDCLSRLIENKDGICSGQIINIGNPKNELSVKELAELLCVKFEEHPMRNYFPVFAGFQTVENEAFYGKGYQDVQYRKPSIDKARRLVSWQPTTPIVDTISKTLDFFLHEHLLSTNQLIRAQ